MMISKTSKIRLVKLTYLYVNSYILFVIFFKFNTIVDLLNISSSTLLFEFNRFV